ncbi:unnamed protein product, partial [Closterium sp. Yama58-4]
MVRIHASVPDVLIGDPTRVGQVMRELITVAESTEPDLEAWIQGLEVRREDKEIEGGVAGGVHDGKVAAGAANVDGYIGDERQREELLTRMKRSGCAECCGAAARDAGGNDGSNREGAAAAGGIGCFGSRQSSGREMGGRRGSSDECCEASFRYSLSQDDPRFSDSPVAGVMCSCTQPHSSQPGQPSQSTRATGAHPADHDLRHGNEPDSFPEPEPWMLHPPIPHPLTAEACRE